MRRRRLAVMLLALLAVQLLGAMAFASPRLEPCPDDTEGRSCPPVCALCMSCNHAQPAIMQRPQSVAPIALTQQFIPQQTAFSSSQLTSDIFHVPLLG